MEIRFTRPHTVVAGLIVCGLILAGLIAIGIDGCTSSGMSQPNASSKTLASTTPHTYLGSASAGDFLIFTVTPTSPVVGTISYTDLTNNESGQSIPYITQNDGSLLISDPAENLVNAYEVPGYALVVHILKAGPENAAQALVTASASGQTSLAGLTGNYNYMHFRTGSGGVEVGSARVAASGITLTGYSPYMPYTGQSTGFTGSTKPTTPIASSSDGSYLTLTIENGISGPVTNTIVGTASTSLIVDTPTGSIIGLPQTASSTFDPGYAGTYSGIYYQKTDVQGTAIGAEIGTSIVDPVNVTVSSLGAVTLTDVYTGSTLATGTLTPVATASYLFNNRPNELLQPCNGMFTFRLTSGGAQQDVFAAFVTSGGKSTIVFSSFWAPAGKTGFANYNYFYGVGLKAS